MNSRNQTPEKKHARWPMILISSLVRAAELVILNLLETLLLHEKIARSWKVMRGKGSLPVCLWVKKSWIVFVWKYLSLNWWTIWNLCFRWINKGMKYSYQKNTSLTCIHTHFLINVRGPKAEIKRQSPHGHWLKII